jgi:pimeloyl-ACP methyl ester carboxylesterase
MPKLTLPSGHTWAYVDANPQGKTTIICFHGFPDRKYWCLVKALMLTSRFL